MRATFCESSSHGPQTETEGQKASKNAKSKPGGPSWRVEDPLLEPSDLLEDARAGDVQSARVVLRQLAHYLSRGESPPAPLAEFLGECLLELLSSDNPEKAAAAALRLKKRAGGDAGKRGVTARGDAYRRRMKRWAVAEGLYRDKDKGLTRKAADLRAGQRLGTSASTIRHARTEYERTLRNIPPDWKERFREAALKVHQVETMAIEALQTVRLEGSKKAPPKIESLMRKHGLVGFFGPAPGQGRPEGGFYRVPTELAEALIEAKLARAARR